MVFWLESPTRFGFTVQEESMLPRTLAAATAALAISLPALAQTTLKVGDQAPALSVAEWIQGDVTGIESGTVHLVEFWATWCGPCKRAIPHLNRLHTTLSGDGFTVIAISDEPASTVRPFVRREGARMSYPVGVDSQDLTKNAWMQAAGRSGIPTSFLVGRDGRIVWIGHPMDNELERILPAVMAGKFDPTLEQQARPLLAAADRAARQRNFREAYSHLDKVIELDPRVFSATILRRYELMLTGERNQQAADAFLREAGKQFAQDPVTLEEFATALASDPKLEPRNLDLAEEFAQQLMRAAPDRARSYATLARVQFAKGDLKQAVDNQQEAWMLAHPNAKPEQRRILDNYRSALARETAAR
jgi:thiol-disulfide isomerase/thioredoxin/Flp pilus assembly protein TadD